ncbi:MAG: photosystem II biogenesis protein Psp29 [Spirulina sp. SIO3F2]|nr:photosystem II biogenesis protein Psp29 [Spirulina sp. SIO3F2]
MDIVRTVSDAKRDFYAQHTRPINSIYRRVIEELMVEMHLLSVNAAFRYDSVYALGVTTAFDRFMSGYTPISDLDSIFSALCTAVGNSPEQCRQDAQTLNTIATQLTPEQLATWDSALVSVAAAQPLYDALKAIAFNDSFKYSRLFAIGLYTVLEQATDEALDQEQAQITLQEMGKTLHLPAEKLKKDLELYQSNLDKLSQAKEVLADALEASRKQRENREAEQAPADSVPSDS